MSNGPDNLEDDDFLPEQPESPVTDLSAFDDAPPLGVAVGSDAEAIKQINKRTSTFGRIVAVGLVILVALLGWAGYRMTIGTDARMEGVQACGQLEEAEMLACLRSEWAKGNYPEVRERIVRNLAHFNDPEALPLYIEGLEEGGGLRRESALGIARLGSPAADSARQPLLDALPDTDEQDRAQVVWALAVLGESSASEAILEQFIAGRLQDMPGWDPGIISRVLGPERLASDELLDHEQEAVRMLTAQALAETGSAEAIDPLTRLVQHELARPADDQSAEVIRAAASGLGRTGDARAAQPLFTLLQSHSELADGILAAIGRSVSAAGLIVLVDQAEDVSTKRRLVELLAGTHDPDAADTLAELLTSEDMDIKVAAATALADLHDERAVDTLLALAAGEDEGPADAALQGLRKLGSARSIEGLLAMLPDHCPPEPEPEMHPGCFRQAAILSALGATGDERAARRIMAALDGVDSPAAAIALGAMHYEPAFSQLRGMVERPADIDMTAVEAGQRSLTNEDLLRTRKGAIQAMGWYGNPDASEALMKVVEDEMDDYELRGLAAAALGRIATPEILQQVIQKIQDAALHERARTHYVQALWQKPQPELNGPLLDLIASDAPSPVRRSTSVAVGYAADPANDARLVSFLENANTRREAAFAIALGGGEDATRALVTALGEDSGAEEILQMSMMGDESEWFDMLTENMFENGAVWRRIRAAEILAEGDRQGRYGYAWLKIVQVLTQGWDGPQGATSQFIRMKLYEALGGEDAARRTTAATLLASMNERALLLKARDAGGPAGEAARAQLLSAQQEQAR
jgi:HEAT repeat protein